MNKKLNELINRLTHTIESGPKSEETPAQFVNRVDNIKREIRAAKRA